MIWCRWRIAVFPRVGSAPQRRAEQSLNTAEVFVLFHCAERHRGARRILTHVPRQRQTLLFSATMPSPIRKLAGDLLVRPVPVQVARVSSPAPMVDHLVYHVEKPDKPALLTRLLADTPHTRVLVFTRTKHGADKGG